MARAKRVHYSVYLHERDTLKTSIHNRKWFNDCGKSSYDGLLYRYITIWITSLFFQFDFYRHSRWQLNLQTIRKKEFLITTLYIRAFSQNHTCILFFHFCVVYIWGKSRITRIHHVTFRHYFFDKFWQWIWSSFSQGWRTFLV